MAEYLRDLVGYGRTFPHPRWPKDARIAVQFVVNYEEGGENAFCMEIKPPRRSYPRSLALSLAGTAPHEHGVDL
jgi:hypothetical protein